MCQGFGKIDFKIEYTYFCINFLFVNTTGIDEQLNPLGCRKFKDSIEVIQGYFVFIKTVLCTRKGLKVFTKTMGRM